MIELIIIIIYSLGCVINSILFGINKEALEIEDDYEAIGVIIFVLFSWFGLFLILVIFIKYIIDKYLVK